MKNLKYQVKFFLPYALNSVIATTAFLSASEINRANAQSSGTQPTHKQPVVTDSITPVIDTTAFNATPDGKSVIYHRNDSTLLKRVGGSRAWRNNNPGNLRYTPFTREHGAIGECGNFAVFPDFETGFSALRALLRTQSYQDLTIAQAIKRYAESYQSYTVKLTRETGLSAGTLLRDLTDHQMNDLVNTIKKIEGWIPGTETVIAKNTPGNTYYMNNSRQRNS